VMLKKQFYNLPFDKSMWTRGAFGSQFSLTHEEGSQVPRWHIQIEERQKSGKFPTSDERAGVFAAIEGGPARYVFRNKKLEIVPVQNWSWLGEESGQLVLVSSLKLFHLGFDKQQVKAAIYPTRVSASEEVQFPVLGSEHFIYLVSGRVNWIDRESEEIKALEKGEMLQISRPNLKKEYLNLKLKGAEISSTVLWVVLHYLPNHK
ncbi:MAG: hypothetical protein ACKN9V_00080, partial [Pseudomonadota bacterium]